MYYVMLCHVAYDATICHVMMIVKLMIYVTYNNHILISISPSINWIEPQLKYWKSLGNQKYVEGLENALVAALSTSAGTTTEADVTTNVPGAAP